MIQLIFNYAITLIAIFGFILISLECFSFLAMVLLNSFDWINKLIKHRNHGRRHIN